MAKQNIISGGFYGKVGSLIGQRWHNIRTVRSYVKPRNPRTEAQQANRHAFGRVCEVAQIGMQMNYKAPCFTAINNSEWALRMSMGSNLSKMGQTGFNRIPVFPSGYIPKYTVSEVILLNSSDPANVRFEVRGTLPAKNREISVLLGYKENEEDEYQIDLYTSLLVAAETSEFSLQMSDPSVLNELSKFLIVSNDDEREESEMVYAPETLMSYPGKQVRRFRTDVVGVSRDDNIFTLTFAEPFIEAPWSISGVSVRGVSNGVFVEKSLGTVEIVEKNGYFALRFEQEVSVDSEILAFPSGSWLHIESLEVENESIRLHAEDAESEVFSSDIERSLDFSLVDSVTVPEGLKIRVAQPYISGTWQANFGLSRALINGSLQTFTAAFTPFTDDTGITSFTLDKTGYSHTGTPLFIDGSEIRIQSVYCSASGVVYKAENVTLEPRDTSAQVTFDSQIKEVMRSNQTFTVVLENQYIAQTNSEISVTFSAVKNGLFREESFAVESLVNVGGKLGLRFVQTVAHPAEIFAFAAGSRVAVKSSNPSVSWSYVPSSENLQAYEDSDLERQFYAEHLLSTWAVDSAEVRFRQGAVAGSSVLVSGAVMQNVTYSAPHEIGFGSAGVSNQSVAFYGKDTYRGEAWVAPVGCNLQFSSIEVTSNGVHYSAESKSVPYSFVHGVAEWQFPGIDRAFTVGSNVEFSASLPSLFRDCCQLASPVIQTGDFATYDVELSEIRDTVSGFGWSGMNWEAEYWDGRDIYLIENDEPLPSSFLGHSGTYAFTMVVRCARLGVDFRLVMSGPAVFEE